MNDVMQLIIGICGVAATVGGAVWALRNHTDRKYGELARQLQEHNERMSANVHESMREAMMEVHTKIAAQEKKIEYHGQQIAVLLDRGSRDGEGR